MAVPQSTFEAPYRDIVLDSQGMLSRTWQTFIRTIVDRLYPLGIERSFEILNNQASPVDIEGLSFSFRGVSVATIDFLVQRVTTGGSAVELIEAGSFTVSYNPTSNDWNITLTHINSPDNSGVDFTITSSGQVQYTSTNAAGTPSISKLFYRARTLAGKNSQYSQAGAR